MDSSTVRWDLSFVDMACSGLYYLLAMDLITNLLVGIDTLTDEDVRVHCYMVHLAYLINSPLLTWVLLYGLLGLKYLMLLVLTLPKWLCIS